MRVFPKAGETAVCHGQGLGPIAVRPVGQLPGHEEALSGRDQLRVRAGSQCTHSVCGRGGERVLEVV